DNVSWVQLDILNSRESVNALKDYDLVLGFLPGSIGYHLVKTCVDAGKDLVDVSFMSENPLGLNDEALKANVTVIPDCGLAPGISNVLVGHAVEKLDGVQHIHIMVGGLPEEPVPPLGYIITWSPESLIDEYTRKARIVREGEIVEVEALSGLEPVDFPGVGRLEAFYTDGLRTLLYTIRNVEDMWEKTLRYPGHAEKVMLLKDLGFFDENPVSVDGLNVPPRKLTAKLFEQKLWKPKVKDIVVLKVEVSGFRNNERIRYVYHLLDSYDEKNGITAMARTTAYPASIIAQLMLKKAVEEKGVLPPEKIGMKDELFTAFLSELEKRGIYIKEEIVA
ncbi:MAG TPA: saccharopine dehydrogenase, partial [Candidatus Bathyarchaeota archaeon]|nr:saccharopine dehydrogenase [Candidatus Bathyarchaeota archaeon]